ncbi:MAG TPA: hypothetical protein VFZ87_09795 [Gemmatimonadales bacterium]
MVSQPRSHDDGTPERTPRASLLVSGNDERVQYRWEMDHPLANFDAAAHWELNRVADPAEHHRLTETVAGLRGHLQDNGERARAEFLALITAAPTPQQAEDAWFTEIEGDTRYLARAAQAVKAAFAQAVSGAPDELAAHRARTLIEGVTGFSENSAKENSGIWDPEYAFTPVEAAMESAYERLLEREGRGDAHHARQEQLRARATTPKPADRAASTLQDPAAPKHRRRYHIPVDSQAIVRQFREEGLSLAKLSELHDVSTTTIQRRLAEAGISTSNGLGRPRRDLDLEKMTRQFRDQGLSLNAIGKLHNVSPTVVYKRLNEAGVKTRDRKSATTNRSPLRGDVTGLALDLGVPPEELRRRLVKHGFIGNGGAEPHPHPPKNRRTSPSPSDPTVKNQMRPLAPSMTPAPAHRPKR